MKILFILSLAFNSLFSIYANPQIDIKKILVTGDGKSIETANKVNSVNEQYLLLDYLKLKSLSQKLIIKDGFFIDAIHTNSKIIYFKIIDKKLLKKVNALTT